MKPILFNTDMVCALLEGRKTVTRRVMKFLPGFNPKWTGYVPDGAVLYGSNNISAAKPPYCPGDILYVRETWCQFDADHVINGVKCTYKADSTPESERVRKDFGYKWRPSIHIPREAARIFLRVTDVRVERLQEITEEQAEKEGCSSGYIAISGGPWGVEDDPEAWTAVEQFRDVWNDCYAKPRPVKIKGVIHHYESYPWEDIRETRTYRGKPWYIIGNPWVWVIEFERCEKPESD